MHEPGEAYRDSSLGELLQKLSNDVTTLIRQEIDLARAEINQRIGGVRASAGMIVAAAVLAIGTFGALTATLILLLAVVLQAWVAALIVTVLYAVVMVVLVNSSKKKIEAAMPPIPQTTQTLKDDVQWAKTQTKSVKR